MRPLQVILYSNAVDLEYRALFFGLRWDESVDLKKTVIGISCKVTHLDTDSVELVKALWSRGCDVVATSGPDD